MIIEPLKLIIKPEQWWNSKKSVHQYSKGIIATEAIILATLPAIIVTIAHLASYWLGFTDRFTAIERAAISFLTITTGALIISSALNLIFLKLAENAKSCASKEQIVMVTMSLISAIWFAGIFQAIAPISSLNPETGEIIWIVFSILITARLYFSGLPEAMGIERRWKSKFIIPSSISFLLLFVLITILPSLIMRYLMGVTGVTAYPSPDYVDWPVPPPPNW
ncbi:MAG: hypothetical protein JXR91_02125 [Deltaproteobacteria bacterium]|nr:hypothetical protein [Deltaproteobacteria bacterium]